MDTTKFSVQLILDEGKWPYIGTARINKNGTINVYLNEGLGVGGGQRLYLRPARKNDKPEADRAETQTSELDTAR